MYFVLLHKGSWPPLPLVDENENIAWFETEEEASNVASENPLGEAFGFEIFELGRG